MISRSSFLTTSSWSSCSLQASWGLFNWHVGQEETTCLIVIWRPVPLKGLSSNLWRAFSPKWLVACKELTNFYWRFPGRKRSPFLCNYTIWSWKPLLLTLRVSPSVYEGVSGKLVCGTKVSTPIRSWSYNAALLSAWSAAWSLCAMSALPFWCPLQWETETSVGRRNASKSLRILSPYLIGDPEVVKWPLSFQTAACACHTRNAYLESVKNTTLFPLPSSKAWVRAMSSAKWAEVPCGKGLASMVSKIGDYCISGSSFSIQDKASFISVPDFLRVGQRFFWQSILRFCPVVQGF